jgi:hypothetical protein
MEYPPVHNDDKGGESHKNRIYIFPLARTVCFRIIMVSQRLQKIIIFDYRNSILFLKKSKSLA